MENTTDVRTDKEITVAKNNKVAGKIFKGILALMVVIFIIFSFQGCSNLERSTNRMEDGVDDLEEWAEVGVDVAVVAVFAKKRFSYASYVPTFMNRTCSSYVVKTGGEGNGFIIPAYDRVTFEVKAVNRGEKSVGVLLVRKNAGARDCAGPKTYNGEISYNEKVVLD